MNPPGYDECAVLGCTKPVAKREWCNAHYIRWRKHGDPQGGRVSSMHGHSRKGQRSPTYRSWVMMVARCTNPNVHNFAFYGGLGIKVCERWRSFPNFLADMGERPRGKTIDRWPDPAGDYEPKNCRWATGTEQARNTKANHIVEVDGAQMPLREAVERFGAASYKCTHLRITRLGWSAYRALATPSQRRS